MARSGLSVYVLLIVQFGLFHQQLKVCCKQRASTKPAESCLCWCVMSLFFSHLWLNRQKDEYWCAFLEAVPRLLILRYWLQLGLLLSTSFASSYFSSFSNSSSILLASARDSKSVLATRISLMASSYSCIFVVIVYNSVPTLAWIALLCWTAWHSCRNATKVRTTTVLTAKQI